MTISNPSILCIYNKYSYTNDFKTSTVLGRVVDIYMDTVLFLEKENPTIY